MESTERAIPFIVYKEREGFKVTEEALEFLNSVTKKVAVVAVAGKYRTGKSYLLNRVLLESRDKGFGVGPTINACTKGLWIWSKPIEVRTGDGEEASCLIIDSEGLGAIDEDANHDTRIFMLSVLLSSYFIYNSLGSIDENALNNMSLIVNLTKNLQVRASDSELDVDEVSLYFPSFLWVIRDFSLQLIDSSGNKISAKEYLENSLQPQKGVSDSVESKNRVRKLIKHFFRERDCFVMVRPTENETALQDLQHAEDSQLRPEFVRQINSLHKNVFKKVRVKSFNGQSLNGEMFGKLAQAYVEAINKGAVPTIEGAWESVCKAECQKQVEVTAKEYQEFLLESVPSEPMSPSKLKSIHKQLKSRVLKSFKDKAIGDQSQQYEEKLIKLVNERFEFIRKKNDKKLGDKCEDICNELQREMTLKLRSGEYSDFQQFKKDFEEECKKLRKDQTHSEMIESKIKEMATELLSEAADYINRSTIMEQQNQNRKLTQQLEFLKSALDTKKEEFHQEKDYFQQRLRSLESENYQLKAEKTSLEMKVQEIKSEKEKLDSLKFSQKEKNNEYKQKYEELQHSYSELLQKHNSEISNLEKQLALAQQEASWRSQEVKELKSKKEELETDFKEIRAQLRLAQEELDSSETRRNRPEPEDWASERNFFKTQIESLKSQIEDNKSVQESLVSALQARHVPSSEASETSKHLSFALEKMEERCQQLDQKVERLKRFQRMVQSASALQCKLCGKVISCSVFSAHISICTKELEKINKDNAVYSIVVPQTIVRETPDSKPYTEYAITVTHKNKTWTITRRYKLFCELHENLQEQFPEIEMPSSGGALFSQNSGSLFSARRPMVLDERRKACQQYLMDLSAIPSVKNSELFRKFLSVDHYFGGESPEKSPVKTKRRTDN